MTTSEVGRFDDLFLAMAGNVGKVEDLLDIFLSFLQRKTDYFHVMESPSEKCGFPCGVAFNMFLKSFEKNQKIYTSRAQPHLLSRIMTQLNSKIVSSSDLKKSSNHSKKNPLFKPNGPPKVKENPYVTEVVDSNEVRSDVNISDDGCPSDKKAEVNTLLSGGKSVTQQDSTKENNNLSKRFDRTTTWNGGKTDKFWWTQSLTDLTIDIVLPGPYPISKNDLNIVIKKSFIKVEYKNENLLNGEFYESITTSGSVWQIEDGVRLVIVLEKGRENWWGCVLKGMEEIDLQKVESVRNIDDYDEETQAAIRKIMFDRDQEMKGLQTSEQMKMESVMRQAWDAEGSPFKGQPFDPKVIMNLQNKFG